MSEVRVLYEERTDHASGDDGSRPDAQRAAGRAAGGGGQFLVGMGGLAKFCFMLHGAVLCIDLVASVS